VQPIFPCCRPSASATIFGNCVVLPEPVSLTTTITGCRAQCAQDFLPVLLTTGKFSPALRAILVPAGLPAQPKRKRNEWILRAIRPRFDPSMKRIVTACLFATVLSVCAEPSAWLIDFEAAKKKASAEKKNLLVNFTGSDWCGYCIQLDKEVFRKEAFLNGVMDKFVLVTIDFPEDESKVDDRTRAQNEELQEKYRVDGYPTILLADSTGRPFAFTGYQEGGAEKYVAHLDDLLKTKVSFDKAVQEATGLEGMDKGAKTASALESLELPHYQLAAFYQEEIRLIESLDKESTLPFLRNLATEKRFSELEGKVETLLEDGKIDEAMRMVDAGIADAGYNTDQRQRMVFFKAVVFMETGKYDDALREIEVCRKYAPDSEVAQGLDVLIHHIEALKQAALVGDEGRRCVVG
jgi:thioredoxin-related protein